MSIRSWDSHIKSLMFEIHYLTVELKDIEKLLDAVGIAKNDSIACRVSVLKLAYLARGELLKSATQSAMQAGETALNPHAAPGTIGDIAPADDPLFRLKIGAYYWSKDDRVFGPIRDYQFPPHIGKGFTLEGCGAAWLPDGTAYNPYWPNLIRKIEPNELVPLEKIYKTRTSPWGL
jgi:hypothetical protein